MSDFWTARTPTCRSVQERCGDRGFACQLRVTAIVDSDGLNDPEMGERNHFARALAVEDVSTVSTMVLPICKAEGCTTAHANV